MFSFETNILLSALTTFIISVVFIPRFIKLASKFRLLDFPGKRASHKKGVPILGGIPMFIGLIFSLLIWSDIQEIIPILLVLIIIFIVGLIDDLISLQPLSKLFFQIFSILILIYFQDLKIHSMCGVLGIYELPTFISILFTVFVVVVIVNSFNLVDGVDGLAGVLGTISSFTFGVIAYFMNQYHIAILAFSISGSLLAFLIYNMHPARLFMGDTGSLVIGMGLSILALNIIQEGVMIEGIKHLPNKGPLIAISLLAIPLFDSLRVFIYRYLKGRHPLYPGRDHFHHALLDLGYGHARTTFIISLISIFTIIITYYLLEKNVNTGIFILAVINYVFLFLPYLVKKYRKR